LSQNFPQMQHENGKGFSRQSIYNNKKNMFILKNILKDIK